jgi:gas vesicle protein
MDRNGWKNFGIGTGIGFVIGFAVAIFTTPKSGKETRKAIADGIGKLGNKFKKKDKSLS